MDKSRYLRTRARLLRTDQSPKLSDATKNLGPTLAQMVFEDLNEPLKGPGDVLWVSPSDLLVGKLALKPPFTSKCLQALTHKGILQIGRDLERQFQNEIELNSRKLLDDCREELHRTVEETVRKVTKDVQVMDKFNCEAQIEQLRAEFERKLTNELASLEEKFNSQRKELATPKTNNLDHKLGKQIEIAIGELTQSFMAKLSEQEDRLVEIFESALKTKEEIRQGELKRHERRNAEALKLLKHKMECSNLANMLYVLCCEREKCREQKNESERELSRLRALAADKDARITQLAKELEARADEVALREILLAEIVKQFQKFINFALRTAPKQGEFLLSTEKMMTFEFTDAMRDCQITPLEPRVAPSEASSTFRDHHDCLNELAPAQKDNGALPLVYFKGNPFVRDDFKGLASRDVELKRSNNLWSKDVEVLTRRRSTVHFTTNKRPSAERRRLFLRSSLKPTEMEPVVVMAQSEQPVRNSKILAAKDSLELLKDKLNSYKFRSEDELKTLKQSELEAQTSTRNLAVDARDSIILRKTSLIKATPKDSIELSRKSSKLASARDSIELLKESLAKLKSPASPCCQRCDKLEETFSIAYGNIYRELKASSPVDDNERSVGAQSVVSFHPNPEVIEEKLVKNDGKLKIVGDAECKEGLQAADEFAEDRIRSLVAIMKQHPYLMAIFTA